MSSQVLGSRPSIWRTVIELLIMGGLSASLPNRIEPANQSGRRTMAMSIHADNVNVCLRTAMGLLLAGLTLGLTQTRAQEPVADTPVAKITIDTSPIVEAPITAADREHWAFSPVKRQPLPSLVARDW